MLKYFILTLLFIAMILIIIKDLDYPQIFFIRNSIIVLNLKCPIKKYSNLV